MTIRCANAVLWWDRIKRGCLHGRTRVFSLSFLFLKVRVWQLSRRGHIISILFYLVVYFRSGSGVTGYLAFEPWL